MEADSPIVNAFVVAVDADRPVHGVGVDAEDVFDFVHQVEGISSEMVDFIDKGKNRDASVLTDAEQLFSSALRRPLPRR